MPRISLLALAGLCLAELTAPGDGGPLVRRPATERRESSGAFAPLTDALKKQDLEVVDRSWALLPSGRRQLDRLRRRRGAVETAALEIDGGRFVALHLDDREALEQALEREGEVLRYRDVLLVPDIRKAANWNDVADAIVIAGGERKDRFLLEAITMLARLDTTRAAIERFATRKGHPPDLGQGWRPLLVGGFLDKPPGNPLVDRDVATRIAVVSKAGLDGTAADPRRAGWVWNEAEGRLYPAGLTERRLSAQMDRALPFAEKALKVAILQSRAALVQAAIADFRAGQGRYPVLAELNRPGTVVASIPANPLNGNQQVQRAQWNERMPPVAGDAGWNYDRQTGRFWPNSPLARRPPEKPQNEPVRAFTTDELIREGVPIPDRRWSSREMARAAEVLGQVAQRDARNLPRNGSEVFVRIMTTKDLRAAATSDQPLQRRLEEAMAYSQGFIGLMEIYLAAFHEGRMGEREVVEIFGAALRMMVVMYELLDETFRHLDPHDPTLRTRVAGVTQMQDGMAGIITTILDAIGQEGLLSLETRRLLARYLRAALPALAPKLTRRDGREVVVRLNTMARDSDLAELRLHLELTAQEVERAIVSAARN